jgi:hypothetical protein
VTTDLAPDTRLSAHHAESSCPPLAARGDRPAAATPFRRPGGWQNRVVPTRFRLLLACPLLVLAGCGNSRTPVPDISRPAPPQGFRTLTLSHAGVSLATPANWTITGQSAPLVVTFNSGPAVVALWRFARSGPPPTTAAALSRARRALITAVRGRDRAVSVIGSADARVPGAGTITLQVRERIDGRLRRVMSTHVYVRGAELVLDEYAPPAQYAAVARSVFAPVLRSLALLPAGR